MYVKQNITGVTSFKGLEIRKNFTHLIIEKRGTSNPMENERISVSIKGLVNEQVSIPNLKVLEVSLISQYGAGYILRQVGADGKVSSSCPIEISANGTLSLFDKEYVSVDLNDLESGAVYDVFAFEGLNESRDFVKYQLDLFQGGEPVQTNYALGASCAMLAIRDNGALQQVTLTGNNGKQVTYTPNELKCLNRQFNMIAVAADVLIEGDAINQSMMGGSVKYFFIPAVVYKSVELHSTGAAELAVIKTNYFRY